MEAKKEQVVEEAYDFEEGTSKRMLCLGNVRIHNLSYLVSYFGSVSCKE